MKKHFFCAISVCLTLMLTLSACGTRPNVDSSGTESVSNISDSTESKEVVMEGKTLSYWYPMWQWEADYVGTGDMGNLWIYQELEKATGVKIEWIHPPIADADAIAAYNVLIASKDLPDIITHPYYCYYPGGSDKAISDNVYINLKPLLEQYAPNYWSLISEDQGLMKDVTTDAGNIWCFYMIDNFAQNAYNGPIYRKDFLDKIGKAIPTTVDELYGVLTAFKNELDLERPISFPQNAQSWIASAYNVAHSFYNDGGTVKYGPIEDGYRKYVTEMHKWYEEGLIPKDFVSPPTADVVMTDGSAGCIEGGFNQITTWTAMASDVDGYELAAGPYVSLNKGELVNNKQQNYRAQQNCTAITTSCKEPEVAVKWLNEKFTEEFKIKGNYGEEGTYYTMVDGKPTYTDAAMHPEDGSTMGVFLYNIAFGKGPYYRIVDRNWFTHLPNAIEAMDIWENSSTGEAPLPEPYLTMPAAEGEEFSAIMADINNYAAESVVAFITGDMDLNQWDSYVEQINSMKIDRALSLKQASYDRYLNR